jgi:hypothetical protein
VGSSMERRRLIAGAVAVLAFAGLPIGRSSASQTPIELDWPDLIPEAEIMNPPSGFSLGSMGRDQTSDTGFSSTIDNITTKFDGKIVRLPGFVVPLNYGGVGVTSLLLVPYVGACMHVPPPPPNQLVLVTTNSPYEVGGMFDPVWATGIFGSGNTSTELADVGYFISKGTLAPY